MALKLRCRTAPVYALGLVSMAAKWAFTTMLSLLTAEENSLSLLHCSQLDYQYITTKIENNPNYAP